MKIDSKLIQRMLVPAISICVGAFLVGLLIFTRDAYLLVAKMDARVSRNANNIQQIAQFLNAAQQANSSETGPTNSQ